jgi:transposase
VWKAPGHHPPAPGPSHTRWKSLAADHPPPGIPTATHSRGDGSQLPIYEEEKTTPARVASLREAIRCPGVIVAEQKVAQFISKHRDRLQIERLPAYAPELNPVEYLWGYLKHHAIPNLCPRNLSELSTVARRALGRIRRKPCLITAFWRQAELF